MSNLQMKSLIDSVCVFISSGFGAGFLPSGLPGRFKRLKIPEHWTGAGFLGSVMGIIFAWAGFPLTGPKGFLILTTATCLGIWTSGRAEEVLGKKDDPRIVVDEILGTFWSLFLIPLASYQDGKKWMVLLAALVLFRIFDVYKIPSRRVQDLKGGFGVVLDDVLSGMAVNVILRSVLRMIR